MVQTFTALCAKGTSTTKFMHVHHRCVSQSSQVENGTCNWCWSVLRSVSWNFLDFTHTKSAQKAASWDTQRKKLLLSTSLFLCFGCPPCIKTTGQKNCCICAPTPFQWLMSTCVYQSAGQQEGKVLLLSYSCSFNSFSTARCMNYLLLLPQGRLQLPCFQAVLS